MQIVFIGNPVFWGKETKNKINKSSAESFTQHAKSIKKGILIMMTY